MTNESAAKFNALYVEAAELPLVPDLLMSEQLAALSSAYDNANDMIADGTMTEFYADAMRSLECLLADGDYSAACRQWFIDRGVRF